MLNRYKILFFNTKYSEKQKTSVSEAFRNRASEELIRPNNERKVRQKLQSGKVS